MTLHSLKISKTFKTYYCQQHWLNLKKIIKPSMKNEKKTPLLPTTFINRFEKSVGTFRVRGGKKPTISMPKCGKYDYICSRKGHLQLP